MALARRLAEVGIPREEAVFTARLAELRQNHAKLLAALGQSHAELVGRLTVAGARPGAIIDRIVSAVIPDAATRQRALETLDVGERLELAVGALAELLGMVAGAQGEEESDDG